MTTYEEAIDVMYVVFKAAWDSGASLIVGYTPAVLYDEPSSDGHDSLDKIFARVTVRNALEDQSSLGSPDGPGQHKYTSEGILIIQIFVPKSDDEGVTLGRRLGMLVRDAFRTAGTAGEVEFTGVTLREQPPREGWRYFNVNADYTFMETV